MRRCVDGEGADNDDNDDEEAARRNTPPTLPEKASTGPDVKNTTLLPISWRRSTAALVTSGIILRERDECIIVCVCDANAGGNGKNVYARLLVNSLLLSSGEEVAVIDGDCIHPEFATPGTVSLTLLRNPLGAPGAAHFNSGSTFQGRADVQVKSFYVGSSSKNNPALYMARVNDLIHCWRNLSASPPSLVINCCVWTRGIGADLVWKTVVAARATHVVNLSSRCESAASSSWRKISSRAVGVAPRESCTTTGHEEEEYVNSVTRFMPPHDKDKDIETLLSRYNTLRRAGHTAAAPAPAADTRDDDDHDDDTVVLNRKVATPNNKRASQAKKNWSEANKGTLQWLVWGLNCVVAHYGCSQKTSTLMNQTSFFTVLKSLTGLQSRHAGGKSLGAWEMMLSRVFMQIPPWRVNFADVRMYGNDGRLLDPMIRENAASLAGRVVGLMVMGLAVDLSRGSDSRSGSDGDGVYSDGECVGVGMIRALNTRSRILYVIAPLSPSELEKVDCLSVRNVQNPPLDFFNHKTVASFVSSSPYVCSNGLATEGTGARAIKSRNNILRKP